MVKKNNKIKTLIIFNKAKVYNEFIHLIVINIYKITKETKNPIHIKYTNMNYLLKANNI